MPRRLIDISVALKAGIKKVIRRIRYRRSTTWTTT